MTFRVEISPTALADVEAAYLYIRRHSPQQAINWFNGLLDVIASLESMPTRCPPAPESKALGKVIRQLLYGKRGGIYRILFGIVTDQTTGVDIVRIYHIRHMARDRLKAEDIE